LRKVEALLASLDDALAETGSADRRTLRRTLAGAVVSLSGGRIRIEAAPRRRRTV
jgi:tRNA(Ile)-lysidine synthase